MNNLDINPYLPPTAPVGPLAQEEVQYQKASKTKRLFNLLLDYAVVITLSTVILTPLMMLEEAGELTGVTEWVDSPLGTVAFMLIFAVYYVILEFLCGRSFGKLVTGTQVLTISGQRPSFVKVVGRSCARLMPFEAMSFLGQNGWHDAWSGTQVVDLRKPKVPPRGERRSGISWRG